MQVMSAAAIAVSALVYLFLCRRASPRILLPVCLAARAFGTLALLAMGDGTGAFFDLAVIARGIGTGLALVALSDVAIRAIPRGSEAVGYGLSIIVPRTVAMSSAAMLVFPTHMTLPIAIFVGTALAFLGALIAAVWIPLSFTLNREGQLAQAAAG
jgi:hypothetical protein